MSTLLPRMLDQPHNSPLALAIRLPRSLMCPAPTCQPLLTRSWRSSVTTPPNHGATLDTGIPPSPPPQGATRSSSSSGPVKKSRKMQVRKGRNGRYVVGWCTVLIHSSHTRHKNLCACKWLTRNEAGPAAESTATDCRQQRGSY